MGADTERIDKGFFDRYAWLKQYARTGMNGVPLAPDDGGRREEKAAYHYVQLLNAEEQTERAEAELAGLHREIGYWANRKDGNDSDEEIIRRIDWKKYPTLTLMREGKARGNLIPLNRSIDFNDETVYGMLFGARNGESSGSYTVDAVKYALDRAQVIGARRNAPYDPAALDMAAQNEEKKVLQGMGTLIQNEAAPKSYTAFKEGMPGLWATGLTKNPQPAGWYVPGESLNMASEGQSGFNIDHGKTKAIFDSRKAGDFFAAAEQGYGVLMGSGGDVSKLSANEGAVRMAIDLALDGAKAFAPEQIAFPATRDAVKRYDAVVNNILGIDAASVAKILPLIIYATTAQDNIKNLETGTVGLMSAILRMDDGTLNAVVNQVLEDDDSLQTAQTMVRLLKLRDMETGRETEAFKAVEASLLKNTGYALQSAAFHTGHGELDDLIGIANQTSYSMDMIKKRWGLQGTNYIGNLLKAGRGDLATAIVVMPTYAKSTIIAEENMRTFGLNDAAVAAQESALAADMRSSWVVRNAKQIAKLQAVEARKAELNAGGTPLDRSALLQMVNDAGKIVYQSKSVLDQAVRKEQAGRNALANAQARFDQNMADTAAANDVIAAIDDLQKAIDARIKAQNVLKRGQQALDDAQQKLEEARKQAMDRVSAQAMKDVDLKRKSMAEKRAKLKQAGEQAGKQGIVPPGRTKLDHVSNESNPLAQTDGNIIIKEGTQGLDFHGAKTLPGMGNVPFRALASSGAASDVQYANGAKVIWPQPGAPFEVTNEHGNIQYGVDGDVDIEMVDSYPGVTPRPTPVPSSTPTPVPTPTPYMPKYTTNLGRKDGYKLNTNAYPGVNESSLMPLGYQKQSVSDMGFYGFIYAGNYLNNSKKDGLVDCVGMNRLPGITWFSYDMYEKLKSEKKMSTYTGPLYDNASRKGRMTAEVEDQKFDGMQLFSEKVRTLEDGTKEKYKNHVVTYYKEITMEFPVGKDLSKFEDCEQTEVRIVYSPDKKQDVQLITFYDVVVHISGKSDGYTGSDGSVYTGKKVDELNRREENEILIDPYQPGKYKYWCALDYVDYGNQVIPESNN